MWLLLRSETRHLSFRPNSLRHDRPAIRRRPQKDGLVMFPQHLCTKLSASGVNGPSKPPYNPNKPPLCDFLSVHGFFIIIIIIFFLL